MNCASVSSPRGCVHRPHWPRKRSARRIRARTLLDFLGGEDEGDHERPGAAQPLEHRANTYSHYGNYVDKDSLHAALVPDQRGLCCYCMTRVEATARAMTIEHWRCQPRNPDLDLSYSLLLAACLGRHGQPNALQHRDTQKGEQDLKFGPADPVHRVEQRVRFELDGTIASSDDEFDTQLDDVLNLNLRLLKNRRENVLTAILDWWRSEKAHLKGPVPNERLARERARRVGGGAGHLRPFDPVAVWWLDQYLARNAS